MIASHTFAEKSAAPGNRTHPQCTRRPSARDRHVVTRTREPGADTAAPHQLQPSLPTCSTSQTTRRPCGLRTCQSSPLYHRHAASASCLPTRAHATTAEAPISHVKHQPKPPPPCVTATVQSSRATQRSEGRRAGQAQGQAPARTHAGADEKCPFLCHRRVVDLNDAHRVTWAHARLDHRLRSCL